MYRYVRGRDITVNTAFLTFTINCNGRNTRN